MLDETTPHVEYGDRNTALHNEILRSVVGSGVHGIAIAGTDDHDEMGIYIAPPEHVVGLIGARDDFTYRTQPEGHRSGHGDVDLIIYSLRKYLTLAIKGNPTALLPLYAPERDLVVRTRLGNELREMRQFFLSQNAVRRFLGYMDAQHERMMGRGKRNRVPNRPELIEKYGWDVKYGAHALRLAYQGYEIAFYQYLSLPLPEAMREVVLEVKTGKIPQETVSEKILSIRAAIEERLERDETGLPRDADLKKISDWAIDAQRRHWGWK